MNKKKRRKKKKVYTIFLERCCCKEEAELSKNEKKLVPKPDPHAENPKWIADNGTRPTCVELGKRKNYSHKIVIEYPKEDFDRLRESLEVKDNESGSYAIPPELLDEFNSHIQEVKVIDLKESRKKREKRK